MFKIIGGVGRKCRICWTMVSMAILLVNLFSILLDNTLSLQRAYVHRMSMIMQTL